MPVMKRTAPLDVAATASRLLAPVQRPAGMFLQALADLLGADTVANPSTPDVSMVAPTPLMAANPVQAAILKRTMSPTALQKLRQRYAGEFYDKVSEMGSNALRTLRGEWPGPYDMRADELMSPETLASAEWKRLPAETKNLLREMHKVNWFEFDYPSQGAQAAFDLESLRSSAPNEDIQKAVLDMYPKQLRYAMSKYMTKALGR